MSDYLDARGEEGGAQFLNSAIKVCNIIGREWDDTCGGGRKFFNLQTLLLGHSP